MAAQAVVATQLVRRSIPEGQNERAFPQISPISIQGSCLIVGATVTVFSGVCESPDYPRFEIDRYDSPLDKHRFHVPVVDPIWPLVQNVYSQHGRSCWFPPSSNLRPDDHGRFGQQIHSPLRVMSSAVA
jgi:hypothetical protein